MKRFLRKLNRIWKLILLFLLIAMVFSYAMFQGGFVSWFLFYSFLPFALYGLLIAGYPIRDWQVKRKIHKYEYSATEEMHIEIELTRNTFFPIFYVMVEDSFSSALEEKNMGKKMLMPGFRRSLTYKYTVKELPRGEHIFDQLLLQIGDPLGLIEKEKVYIQVDRILVYPPFEEMVYKPLENHYEQGMTSSKERVQRDTTMAVGIREYQPGDRFSWINWKASARRNNMMTKEFEQKQSHDIMIVMDCEENNRFDAVVSFAASITRAILKKGAQVGLLSIDVDRTIFPIRGGESQQQLLLYHLAKVRTAKDITLAEVLDNESSQLPQQAAVMLITSKLTRELVEKVGWLSSKRYNVAVFVVTGKKEGLSSDEKTLSAFAAKRGIRVLHVSEGRFKEAFGEVVA
ncbi:DUF58 domain-containing protein [Niallia sp.]|uniref:DUF58 domain-containing protein n=1 Tax=Niallia sp. TaxID=2837523 RepID=UPI0028A24A88|nr:DUF58 domain-containing protein [Niallia sp.]